MKRELINGVVNRVALVGIELEGGWDHSIKGEQIVRDGSVRFNGPRVEVMADVFTGERRNVVRGNERLPQYDIGEIVSKAIPIGAVEAWLKKCYPHHVNETCGLHVHMSFYNKLNYSRLIVPDFTPFVVEELKAFGRATNIPAEQMFWRRLDPDHPWTREHCRHVFLGNQQVLVGKKDYNSRGTDHSRYTFINYCDKLHNTVECRGLPMFGNGPTTPEDVELALKAIMAVVTATNRFLSKQRSREKTVQVSITERPALFQEIGSVVR